MSKQASEKLPVVQTTSVAPSTLENGEPPQKPGQLKKFTYDFWAPEIAHLRGLYIKIIASTIVLLTLIVWVCLPVYWGSLWKAQALTKNLRAWVIDRDGGAIGQAITSGILETTTTAAKDVLGWQQIDASLYPTEADVEFAVVDERSWIAVVIEENATSNLERARENGDSSYDPTSAISVIYAQGRNEIAVGSYVLPITNALLGSLVGRFSAQFTAQYVQGIAGNETAVGLLAQAPRTIVQPVYWTPKNVRPYTQQVATAITLVGQIYVIILAFFLTMAGGGAREILGPYLNMKAYLKMRIVIPLILYVPLSLIYSMINLPFKLPFDAKYTYAGGFFLFWVLMYVGMCALGLSTEAAFTILGPRFMGYFLIPLIVVNISITVLPNELQVWFFKYGYGFPVFNMSQGIRTIIFNTKNHLGRNFGVLIAWAVLSLITVPLLSYIFRRKEMREEESSRTAPAQSTPNHELRRETEGLDRELEREIESAEDLDHAKRV